MILQSAPAIGEGISGPTPAQQALAAAIVALVLLAVVVSHWRSRYAGLPDEQARHKSAINSAKAAAALASARFDRGTDMAAQGVRETLRRLFEGREPPRTTPREAADEFLTTVARGVAPSLARGRERLQRHTAIVARALDRALVVLLVPVAYLRMLPRSVAVPLAVALGISITGGSIVLAPALARLVAASGPSAIGALATAAIEGTLAALDAAVGFLAAAGILGTVALQVGTLAYLAARWLFVHWYVPAAILAVGAALLYALERVTPTIAPDRRRHPLRAFVTAVLAVVVIWAVAAGAAVQGGAWGYPRVGQAAAVLLAALLAAFVLAAGAYEYARGLAREARRVAATDRDLFYVYLVARRLWILLSVLFAPLVPAYVVIGLARVPYGRLAAGVGAGVGALQAAVAGLPPIDGAAAGGLVAAVIALPLLVRYRGRVDTALPEFEGRHRLVATPLRALTWTVAIAAPVGGGAVIVATIVATTGVLGIGLLVMLAVLVGAAHLGRAAWPTIRAAGRELLADQALRVVLGAYAFPFVSALTVYIVLYGFVGDGSLLSVLVVGSIAVAVAGLGRALYGALVAAKYRAALFAGGGSAAAGRVTIEAATLSVDGEEYYYARLNGDTELLREDRAAIVDEIATVATALFEDGAVPATIGQRHHDNAVDLGILDIEATREKTREEIRKALYRTLREENHLVERDRLDDRLDEYPRELRERRLDREVVLGNLRRGGEVVELRNDPFA